MKNDTDGFTACGQYYVMGKPEAPYIDYLKELLIEIKKTQKMEKSNKKNIIETSKLVNELANAVAKSNAFSQEKQKINGLTAKLSFSVGVAYGTIERYEEIMKNAGIEF